MFDKMKELMEMKKQADRLKKELDSVVVDVEEVRGIKIRISGSQQIQGIEIDETHLNADNKGRFEKDLMRSLNAATKRSQRLAAEKMKTIMPGGLPGM